MVVKTKGIHGHLTRPSARYHFCVKSDHLEKVTFSKYFLSSVQSTEAHCVSSISMMCKVYSLVQTYEQCKTSLSGPY